MTEQEDRRSECCNAEIRVEGGMSDFMGSKEICTVSFICTECGKGCNEKEQEGT